MRDETMSVIFGGLLHDVGKVIYRANEVDGRNHSTSGAEFVGKYTDNKTILDAVRYHHIGELRQGNLPKDSEAYIIYIADNIAAGADRREIEGDDNKGGFDKQAPLTSVFNLLNGNNGNDAYELKMLEGEFFLPKDKSQVKAEAYTYKKIYEEFASELKYVAFNEKYTNSLLSLLEACFSLIPSSTSKAEVSDISLYDHLKLTAAIGACICEFMHEKGDNDYKELLMTKEKEFMDKKTFLMYSCDFSGIQSFIYNIASKHALKSLRSRSFFLEILMEHFSDEVVRKCGVSRANIIYSGGGHCYILLPNTNETKENLDTLSEGINDWLIKNFGTGLYLASAYRVCSGNDLINEPKKEAPYKKIFIELNSMLSDMKISRYTSKQLLKLNSKELGDKENECKICGTTYLAFDDDQRCKWCDSFEKISSNLLKKGLVLLVSKKKLEKEESFTLPTLDGEAFAYIFSEEEARNVLREESEVLAVYSKNQASTGMSYSTKINMGDYAYSTVLETLSEEAEGIKRIGVYRADVDNLGQAFISGFERSDNNIENAMKYVTLSRAATFSRQITMFFKYYINSILDNKKVAIIYSGGDDIFLVGAWCDVIEVSILIEEAFKKYTSDTLTISAGIGIYSSKYPMYRAAEEAAQLEDASKNLDGKNAVSLFVSKIEGNPEVEGDTGETHTYKWQDFKKNILDEKLNMLKEFFDYNGDDQNHGKAFLYRLLNLIRESDKKINIARYAYLLSRLEPTKGSVEYKKIYGAFSKKMYSYIHEKKDRMELTTAIYIYNYMNRKRS